MRNFVTKFNLHVVHININGLRDKKNELSHYLEENKVDVVCINESRLNKLPAPTLTGFIIASRRDRSGEKASGGGVIIYTRPYITSTVISIDKDDITAINISIGKESLVIVSYYVPPDKQSSIDSVTISSLTNKHNNILITGDLNAKNTFYGSKSTNIRGDELFNLVEQHDLIVLNNPNEITHTSYINGSSDLIDYAVVSKSLARK